MDKTLVRKILILALLLPFQLSAFDSTYTQSDHDRVVIVVNSQINKLSKQQVRALFSLQRRLLPSNKNADIAVLSPQHESTAEFSKRLFNYYPYQLQRLWDREVFAGRAQHPQKFETAEELLEFIANNENAIGYVSLKTANLDKYKDTIHVLSAL